MEGIEFHDTTLIGFIIRDSFQIFINANDCIVVAKFYDNEFWDNKTICGEDMFLYNYLEKMKINPFKINILAPALNSIFREIGKNSDENGMVGSETFQTIVRERIKEDALESKIKEKKITNTLNCLYGKRGEFERITNGIKETWEKSSNRRLNGMYFLIGLQVFFTQYGTYVKYSWDIMEPITC